MKRPEILDKAKACVCGQREQDYGTPEDNFAVIAALWGDFLWHKHPELQKAIAPNKLIDSATVAALMALLKIARIASGPEKADSWIDLAGYAACGGEIATHKDEVMDAADKMDRAARALACCGS